MNLEAAAAANSEGVSISKAEIDEMHKLICQFDAIKTSMLVDREKGRPLELDGICGAVIRRAKKHGLSVPITELVNQLLIDN